MRYRNTKYRFKECTLSIFLMITLVWLTISAPFVFDAKKKLQKSNITASVSDINQSIEENSNPFAGLNEEKCSSNSNTLSEYLHEHFHMPELSESELIHESYTGGSIYVAYYGELLSPPPEV